MQICHDLEYQKDQYCDVYYNGQNMDKKPVVIVIYGGAFIVGDKTHMHDICTFLYKHLDVVCIAPNYTLSRLDVNIIQIGVVLETISLMSLLFISKSGFTRCCLLAVTVFLIILSSTVMMFAEPNIKARHPRHVKDVAQSIAWTRRECHNYGGDQERIFLLGHSAGAMLAALVTLNTRFLNDLHVPINCIQGVICISGPYSFFRIQESNVRHLLNGNVFGSHGDDLTEQNLDLLTTCAGPNGESCTDKQHDRWSNVIDAWPIFHCHNTSNEKKDIPFLLMTAGFDWSLIKHANDFEKSLADNGFHVQRLHFKQTTHFSIRLDWNHRNKDVGASILQFINHIIVH